MSGSGPLLAPIMLDRSRRRSIVLSVTCKATPCALLRRSLRGTSLISVCVVLLSGAALAGNFDDLASTPSPQAADTLAKAESAFKASDNAIALRFYRPLADQGVATARLRQGLMYIDGLGVPQSYVDAEKWIRVAAEQGHALGQLLLGSIYHDGRGVPRNNGEAAKWYRLAADQGLAAAQYNLGRMYFFGQGVSENYVTGLMWLNLSAAQGDQDAIKFRAGLINLMNPSQVAAAQKLAAAWKPQTSSAPH